jgi:hypothetical protein
MYTTVASCTVLFSAIHAVQRCPQDQLLELIHQGGLITRLKGCMVEPRSGNPHNPYGNPDGPADAIDTLTELWTRKAAEVSRELYTHIEGEHFHLFILFLFFIIFIFLYLLSYFFILYDFEILLFCFTHYTCYATAIDTLTELWTRKAAEVSRELYKRIEGGCTDVWCLFL